MICSSCGDAKAELHAKKSELIPSMKLLLCNNCLENKYEPRYLIILYSRSIAEGVKDAKLANFIEKRRYVGKDILAKDIV